MRSANGRHPQKLTIDPADSGSALIRSLPMILPRRARASSGLRTSRATRRIESSPPSGARLVIKTAQSELPGSSGRTCASFTALSRTNRTRRELNLARYIRDRPSRSSGIICGSTPNARRNSSRTLLGSRGWLLTPLRSTKSWPSGKRCRSRWATWTAKAVLPTPPFPEIAEMTMADGSPLRSRLSSARSCPNSSPCPVKS